MEDPPQKSGCCWRETGFSGPNPGNRYTRLLLSTSCMGEAASHPAAGEVASWCCQKFSPFRVNWERGYFCEFIPFFQTHLDPAPMMCWNLSSGRPEFCKFSFDHGCMPSFALTRGLVFFLSPHPHPSHHGVSRNGAGQTCGLLWIHSPYPEPPFIFRCTDGLPIPWVPSCAM